MLTCVLRQATCGLAFLLFGAGVANAGSFVVSPVRATLSSAQSIGSLVVHNNGSEPTVVQLELATWSQQDGKDAFVPTREVLATPPIFTVPPGGSQTVRVGLRRAPDAQSELSYRLFLQEVPPPPKPGVQGLQMALRISIPVFVKPAVAAAPVLRWQAVRAPQGQVRLSVANNGNAHIQVNNIKLASADGADIGSQQVASYVLPGQSRDWLVKAAVNAGAKLRLSAQTDNGDVQSDVIVE